MTPTGPRRRLGLVPLQPGEWLALTPTRVRVRGEGWPADERQGPNDYRITNEFLNRLQQVRIGDVPFFEFVSYRGLSMWQFLPSYIWPEVFRAVELAEVVAGLLEEAEPEQFEAEPSADVAASIWAGVVRAAGIPLRPGRVRPTRRSPRAVAGALRRRLRRGRAVSWPAAESGGVLCATQGARYWVRRPDGEGFYDEQFSLLIPALRAQGWGTIRFVDCQDLPAEALHDRKLGPNAEWYFPGVLKLPAAREARAHFARLWEALSRDESFRDALSHRGISLFAALAPTLRRAFRETLPDCVGYLAGASQLLDATRPEAVVVSYEQGPHQRALLIEAARRAIPSVGLQHGMIFDNHYDYLHSGVTTDPIGKAGFAVPLVTCVWGDYWRDVLVERGSYPPDAVAVTGNPRVADVLEHSRGSGRAEIRARLGLPADCRVVLLLTANQRSGDFVDAGFAALAGHADCVPLVKPHPSDDVAMILDKLRAHGYGDRTLHRRNLAEAILAADLVVCQLSTTALETMLFRRPLVLVNLDRCCGYAGPIVGTGLARYAETPEELLREVAAALDVENFERETATLHGEFIGHWFAGADGEAAERIAGVITTLAPRSGG